MTQTQNIERAMSIYKNYDWWWMMDDYAYSKGLNRVAEATMREFVKAVSGLSSELKDAMRSMWIAKHTAVHSNIFSKNEEAIKEAEEKEEIVKNLIAA